MKENITLTEARKRLANGENVHLSLVHEVLPYAKHILHRLAEDCRFSSVTITNLPPGNAPVRWATLFGTELVILETLTPISMTDAQVALLWCLLNEHDYLYRVPGASDTETAVNHCRAVVIVSRFEPWWMTPEMQERFCELDLPKKEVAK